MTVEVDAINLQVEITSDNHMIYGGHFIQIVINDGLSVCCLACDEEYSFDECPDGLHKWEATFYLVGNYSERCCGSKKDVRERVQGVLQDYVGQAATRPTVAAMKKEIRDVVGDETRVNVTL